MTSLTASPGTVSLYRRENLDYASGKGEDDMEYFWTNSVRELPKEKSSRALKVGEAETYLSGWWLVGRRSEESQRVPGRFGWMGVPVRAGNRTWRVVQVRGGRME